MTATDYVAADQLYRAGLNLINTELNEAINMKNKMNPESDMSVINGKIAELQEERTAVVNNYDNLWTEIRAKLKSGF